MPMQLVGTAYQRRIGVMDNDDEYPRPPPTPPELTEDYLAAQRRADHYLRMYEEGLTIFDEGYWQLLFSDLRSFVAVWNPWLKGKLFMLGLMLSACIGAGSILVAFVALILTAVGPIRIKSLGVLLISYVMVSTFVTGRVEVAASSVLGLALLSYIFLLRVSTGSKLQRGISISEIKEPPVYLVMEFWYVGKRSLWINLKSGYVGLN